MKQQTEADVTGNWKLIVDFQGQKLPVTLRLRREGDALTGMLETMLGNGKITECSVEGNNVSARAATEIQGETVEFAIEGTIDGDALTGTVEAPIVPQSLSFTGTRE
jgi:hypothetical protein